MIFPETTVYEVWQARGGMDPTLVHEDLPKELADRKAEDLRRNAELYLPPEAARLYYAVVAVTTTRREVHG